MKLAILALAALLPAVAPAAGFESAATSTNQIGLDLFRKIAAADPKGNVLLSPYSIESALAMTYAGAEGDTRAEMAQVLGFPPDDTPLAASFKELRAGLDNAVAKSAQAIEWHVANRLFAQQDYAFRQPFRDFVAANYAAPLQSVDFKHAASAARDTINKSVADQTEDKIRDLIPPDGVNAITRLALVNALYFKAPWGGSFRKELTRDGTFRAGGTTPVNVPMMHKTERMGYAKREGYTAVTLPYLGGGLQFLLLLPDDPGSVDALAAGITAQALRENAKLSPSQVNLSLPKFKMAGPTINLKEALKTLGMKTAFDLPPRSANFDRMAPRQPNDYLFIQNVFHKTYLDLDEEGTEASAATAVMMAAGGGRRSSAQQFPIVNVDHPFLFAIQHRESGACLFIGRVNDPRPASPSG